MWIRKLFHQSLDQKTRPRADPYLQATADLQQLTNIRFTLILESLGQFLKGRGMGEELLRNWRVNGNGSVSRRGKMVRKVSQKPHLKLVRLNIIVDILNIFSFITCSNLSPWSTTTCSNWSRGPPTLYSTWSTTWSPWSTTTYFT